MALPKRLGSLAKDQIVAPAGFNRWWIPPAAIGMHMCIGSVYSWSVFNPVLVKEVGVVASAPGDRSLGPVVLDILVRHRVPRAPHRRRRRPKASREPAVVPATGMVMCRRFIEPERMTA